MMSGTGWTLVSVACLLLVTPSSGFIASGVDGYGFSSMILMAAGVSGFGTNYTYPNPEDRQDTVEYYKCPDDDWVIGKFDNVISCYRPMPFYTKYGEDLNINLLKHNYCKYANEDAYIGNVHSHEEMLFLRDEFLTGVPPYRSYGNIRNLIVGVYKQVSKQWKSLKFTPMDGIAFNYLRLEDRSAMNDMYKNILYLDLEEKTFHISDPKTAINENGAAFLCKMDAEKRPEYPPMEENQTVVDLLKYECGDKSSEWQIAHVCGEVNCYRVVDKKLWKYNLVQWNECAEYYPGANFASIHCKAEEEFLRQYDPAVIGLVHPRFVDNFKPSDFKWQDGSPMNYFNLFTKRKFGYNTQNVAIQQVDDAPYGWIQSRNISLEKRVCKIKARLPHEIPYDEEWKPVPTKTVDGQECADLGRSLTTTQCRGYEYWKQEIGGEIYCYLRIKINEKYQSFLDNSLCQGFHKQLKAASIESKEEYGFFRYNWWRYLGLYLPANIKNPRYSDLVWADGTKNGYKLGEGKIDVEPNKPLYFGFDSGSLETGDDAKHGLCKMKALPINKCPKPFNNAKVYTNDYKCKKGWTRFKACNQVSCYKTLKWEDNVHGSQVIAEDICARMYSSRGAHMASIHCDREDRFIRNKYGKVLLPLLYKGEEDGVPKWEWTDKSDFNYMAPGWINFDKSTSDIDTGIFTTNERGNRFWQVADDKFLEGVKILCKYPAELKKSN